MVPTQSLRHFCFLSVLILIWPVLSSCTNEAISIELNLKKGQVIKQDMIMVQKITQKIMGRAQNIDQEVGLGFVQVVDEVDSDGQYHMKCTFDSIRQETKMPPPAPSIKYDSRETDESSTSPQAQILGVLLGQSFKMKINRRGEVTDVSGIDKLFDKMLEVVDMPSPQLAEMMKKQLKSQFGDEQIMSMFGCNMAFYPEKPVKVGDSWSSTFHVKGSFAHIQDNTYTLTKKDGNVLHIMVDSKLTPDKEGKPIEMGTFKMKINLSGEQKGMLRIAANTGLLIGMELDQKLSGNAIMQGIPGQEEMRIPMTIDGKLLLKEVK